MTRRRQLRTKHNQSLEERLADEAMRLRVHADLLPLGPEHEAIVKKGRQADTTAHLNEWLTSPGLRRAQ
ncbi:hypothetical protein [Bradyrhizobium genosp. P]|uniref:hypothetical protein n=1 Tax=Bradyrhizobium genosp. P TaxID=83641 RepID=UPI003CEC09D4